MSQLYVNRNGAWKTDTQITDVSYKNGDNWLAVDAVYRKKDGVWQRVWQGSRTHTITSTATNITVGTGGIFSGYTSAKCTLIINSGVVVGSTATDKPAINVVSNFTNGLTIINNGYVHGKGGAGGGAGVGSGSVGTGKNGGVGGNAIHLVNQTTNTVLNNKGTFAAGGGGGGGGGGYAVKSYPAGGGGGGGGAGYQAGAGAAANTGGAGGNSGSRTTGGSGGAGTFAGGSGGKGGNQGASGSSGGGGLSNGGGSGGAAGYWTTNRSEITYTGTAPLGRSSG